MSILLRGFLIGILIAVPWVALGQHDVSPPEVIEAIRHDTISVCVDLTFDPQSPVIDAFSFDFHYPDSLLTFLRVSASGTLTEGWIMVDGSENSPGVVRTGGFNLEPISATGVLVYLHFKVGDAIGESWLRLTDFVDDLEGATTTDGLLKTVSQTGIGITPPGGRGGPPGYTLEQNFPNPFNPTTTIRYAIPSAEHRAKSGGMGADSELHALRTTLRIYNVLGQEVRTLVDESQQAGYYSVTWAGKNAFGHEVTSGVYYCRLTVGETYTATRCLIFMK